MTDLEKIAQDAFVDEIKKLANDEDFTERDKSLKSKILKVLGAVIGGSAGASTGLPLGLLGGATAGIGAHNLAHHISGGHAPMYKERFGKGYSGKFRGGKVPLLPVIGALAGMGLGTIGGAGLGGYGGYHVGKAVSRATD